MIAKAIQNEFYEIGFDQSINRMYLRIKGFWKNREQVANYTADMDKICQKMQPGFTLLTDLRQMKTPPLEVNLIHKEAQEILNSYGLARTAELLQKQDIVLDRVMKKIASDSGMKKQEFTTMKDGEAWLDQVEV